MKPVFRFIDLFAGLGGFHQAAQNIGGTCVFASEIDLGLRTLYKKNFGLECAGDIRNVAVDNVPDHDLLCAGFPCQPFSKAGDQMGWKDTIRGTVFWNITEILKHRKPSLVILENVAHFVRHDSGNTYAKVKKVLESLGYTIDVQQYSPHQFGIPQIRERIYMVGSLNSLDNFHWPNPFKDNKLSIKSVLDEYPVEATPLSDQVIRCIETWQEFLNLIPLSTKLPSFPIWAMEFGATYPYHYDSLSKAPLNILKGSKGIFGKSLNLRNRGEIYKLVPSYAKGDKAVFPKWKQSFIRQNREFYLTHKTALKPWIEKIRRFPPSLQKLEWNCQGEKRNLWEHLIQFRASGVRIKRSTTSPSLVAMTSTQIPIIAWEKRYMTPRECARLQSMERLPHLPSGIAAMKALGNAVNVKVVEHILGNLITLLNINKTVTQVSPEEQYAMSM